MTFEEKKRRDFCELNANAIGIDDTPFIICKAENENEAVCLFGGHGWFSTTGQPFELNEKHAAEFVTYFKNKGVDAKMVSKISWSKNQLAAAR